MTRRVCPECGESFGDTDTFCPTDGARLKESDDELIGSQLGSYRIIRLLGEGGMGRVYLGQNQDIESRVAIKVLSHDAKGTAIERFFREARVVNRIRHEGIINVLDLNHLDDGRPYIIMEYLDGEPLSAYIARGPMASELAAHIGVEVLDALQAAHAQGVVHRDLKPDNIFISPKGRCKILDFGIAKLIPSFDMSVATFTRSGAMIGTPAYMAPEQINGDTVSQATDIFALGVVLYECVAGRRPFDGGNLFDLMQAILRQAPLPIETSAGPLTDIIHACLNKTPAERPAAINLQERLRSLTDDHAWSRSLERIQRLGIAPTIKMEAASASQASADLEPAPTSQPPKMVSPPARPQGRRNLVVAALLAAGLALAVAVALIKHDPPAVPEQTADIQAVSAYKDLDTSLVDARSTRDDPADGYQIDDFDLKAFLPRARELASEVAPTLWLEIISVQGVGPQGTLDLSDPNAAIQYTFGSPPYATDDDPQACGVTVSVWYLGVLVSKDSGRCEPDKKISEHICSLAEVWELAQQMASIDKVQPLTMQLTNLEGSPRWSITNDSLESLILRCNPSE